MIIATGQRTGHAADVGYVRLIQEATSLPVVVGSGATLERVNDILSVADGVIVGSALKEGGVWWSPVDRLAAQEFVAQSRQGNR